MLRAFLFRVARFAPLALHAAHLAQLALPGRRRHAVDQALIKPHLLRLFLKQSRIIQVDIEKRHHFRVQVAGANALIRRDADGHIALALGFSLIVEHNAPLHAANADKQRAGAEIIDMMVNKGFWRYATTKDK